MKDVALNVLKKIALSLLTEKVMIKLVLLLLDKLAAKTSNSVDDDLVALVREALTGESGNK